MSTNLEEKSRLDKCFDAVARKEQAKPRQIRKPVILIFYDPTNRNFPDPRAEFTTKIKDVGVFNIKYFFPNKLKEHNTFKYQLQEENPELKTKSYRENNFKAYQPFI